MDASDGYVRLALAMLVDSLRHARRGDQAEREWLLTEGRHLLKLLGVDATEREIINSIEKPKGRRRRLWTH